MKQTKPPACREHRKLLREILKHQVANLGHRGHEFYACYTYGHGEMPVWVAKAKALLRVERGKRALALRERQGLLGAPGSTAGS